jgi:hypothetical protein
MYACNVMYTCANALRGSSGSIPFLAFSAKELREILLDRHVLLLISSETIAGIACKRQQISLSYHRCSPPRESGSGQVKQLAHGISRHIKNTVKMCSLLILPLLEYNFFFCLLVHKGA